MVWLQFLGSALLVVLAAVKLAEYGDALAVRTGIGRLFIGTLLMASATSLPEFLTMISALNLTLPNLAAGNIFGSNMFNMFLLGLLDMLYYRARILRRVAMRHAISASMASLLIGMATFFILADLDFKIGWVGLDSLLLIATYLAGARLIHAGSPIPLEMEPETPAETGPSLRRAVLGFVIATGVLVLVTPQLVNSSATIAEITGLSTGFIGTALLATVTSLPEMVAMIAAARLGSYDLAVGNLFGSNLFNIFALGLIDLFYTPGRFLGAIDPIFAISGLLGLLLTNLGLIGNLARLERRILFVEIDALLLILAYLGGMGLLYLQGLPP